MFVRVMAALCLAMVVAIGASQPALGAMSLRIQLDGPAVVGVPARVTVTTVLPERFCADDPSSSPVPNGTWYTGAGAGPSDPAFRLITHPADRPDRTTDIALVKRAPDSAYWDGLVTYPTGGDWVLRMASPNWGQPYSDEERCAGARITVHVRDGPASSLPALPLAALAGVVTVAVAALALIARRRRRRMMS